MKEQTLRSVLGGYAVLVGLSTLTVATLACLAVSSARPSVLPGRG